MLPTTSSTPSPLPEDRAARRQRFLDRLQAQAAPLLEQLADALVDAPDRDLFRAVELQARDLGQHLAAAAQQAGLDERKKGGM
jgi:hypothetical protein